MKTCSKCKVEKELGQFHTDNKEKDRKSVHCKPCRKVATRTRYLRDKDKILKSTREYYHENKEQIKIVTKENYTPEKRERYLAQKKQYRKSEKSKQYEKIG